MSFEWLNKVKLFAPSCAGQLHSLMAGVSENRWPKVIGADDLVEGMLETYLDLTVSRIRGTHLPFWAYTTNS